jgi:hypothetical protein
MAMDGPDARGGNVTIVGRVDGYFTVITLEGRYLIRFAQKAALPCSSRP